MVPGFVAPDPARKSLAAHDAEADGGHSERKDGVCDPVQTLRKRHRRECGIDRHRNGGRSHHRRAHHDQGALPGDRVDKRARRPARQNRRHASDGESNPRAAWVPVLAGGEEDRQERPDAILHISQKKIQPIESGAIAVSRLRLSSVLRHLLFFSFLVG